MDQERWISRQSALRRLHVADRTLQGMIERGELRTRRTPLNRTLILISEEDVIRLERDRAIISAAG
jgi:hypothetical protein